MGSKDKSGEEEDEGLASRAEGISSHGHSLTEEGGDRGGN